MHGELVVVLHTDTSYHMLCCALIGEKGGKVCFQKSDSCDIQLHSNVCRQEKFEASI